MAQDSGHQLAELMVDGGMSNSELCMQTQADLARVQVNRPKMRETTALGAAIAAGLAVGVWKSVDELKDVNTRGLTTFVPKLQKEESDRLFERWTKAVYTCSGFV